MASLGPMPLTVMSFSNSFSHVGVNVQGDLAANSGQIGKRRNADSDVVSDASSLDDGLVGVLGQQLSAQMGNHGDSVVSRRSSVVSLNPWSAG